jgi:hypothetical protein
MKKFFHSLLFVFCAAATLSAQTGNRTITELLPHDFLAGNTALHPIRLTDVAPFLAYSVEWEANSDMTLEIQFYEAGRWGEWTALRPDAHSERKAPQFISELGFAPAASTHFTIRILPADAAADLSFLRVHCYNPGNTPDAEAGIDTQPSALDCPCPLPAYLDRTGWCPSGNCPTDPTPVFTEVTHLIVHHSAGANSSSDWPAVVRSIWDYHVNSNGWDDIGYNWLIDANGVLYEGRGNDLQGAHFCGTNGNTMGICVLGTYTSVLPTPQAIQALTFLLGWKACERNIDPEDFEFHAGSGLNLFNISGHRDGCATACPGDSLYARLPSLRSEVATYIQTCDVSSTEESPVHAGLLAFPNPASELLRIQAPLSAPAPSRIYLTDASGRVVWQPAKAYAGGEEIHLSVKGWPRGWYALHAPAWGKPVKILLQ